MLCCCAHINRPISWAEPLCCQMNLQCCPRVGNTGVMLCVLGLVCNLFQGWASQGLIVARIGITK
jgi:hypothetical protein